MQLEKSHWILKVKSTIRLSVNFFKKNNMSNDKNNNNSIDDDDNDNCFQKIITISFFTS